MILVLRNYDACWMEIMLRPVRRQLAIDLVLDSRTGRIASMRSLYTIFRTVYVSVTSCKTTFMNLSNATILPTATPRWPPRRCRVTTRTVLLPLTTLESHAIGPPLLASPSIIASMTSTLGAWLAEDWPRPRSVLLVGFRFPDC